MIILSSRVVRTWRRLGKYITALFTALWLTVTIPGCFWQSQSPTTSALPSPIQPSSTVQRFDGITVNLITRSEVINTGLKRRIPEFEALTGARINLVSVPVGELYKVLETDWSGSTSKYDAAVVIPQWLINFINAGHLEDLTDRIQADTALQWQDVAAIFRDVSATYKGHNYGIPLDGDFHMVYYRRDLLKQAGLVPPATWEDYLAIAQQFHGKDLNGDGEADYGSCITKQFDQLGYVMFSSIASPYLQAQGTEQGMFFDLDTMKPLVNNPGFARALEIYRQTMEYGVPDDRNLGLLEARKLFISGRCALTLDWGDIGTLAIDPVTSKVIDKVGAVITPGSTQVLDRKTGQLVSCDKFTCPYAINDINHAPYAAIVGWTGVVHDKAAPTVKDAAYAFLSYVSQPEQANVDVTIGTTGFNPYRISQFENADSWLNAGMSSETANNYLGAIGISLNSPNMVLDLRIPHNQRYQLESLSVALADFLANKLTVQETMQRIEREWEQLTNQAGRESQRATYRSSLGLQS